MSSKIFFMFLNAVAIFVICFRFDSTFLLSRSISCLYLLIAAVISLTCCQYRRGRSIGEDSKRSLSIQLLQLLKFLSHCSISCLIYSNSSFSFSVSGSSITGSYASTVPDIPMS